MKSLFSAGSHKCSLGITIHSSDTLAAPVPEKAFVVLSRNSKEVGRTENSMCTGKGNSCWDQLLKFDVTMFLEDDGSFKEKRLSIKIKDARKKTSIAKGDVNLAPHLSPEGAVKKIRLLLDPKKSSADKVGLTVSLRPTWVDTPAGEEPSEMSGIPDDVSEMSDASEAFDDDMEFHISSSAPAHNAPTPTGRRARAASTFEQRSEYRSRGLGHRKEANRGGIPIRGRDRANSGARERSPGRERANSSSLRGDASRIDTGGYTTEQVEDMKMEMEMLQQRLQVAEEDARNAHEQLQHRTRLMQESSGPIVNGVDVERLQELNEELQTKVMALTAQLDVSCTASNHGVTKPSKSGTEQDEYVAMLEMELIQAKTKIAELQSGYDGLERGKRELDEQKKTWKSGRGHRRTSSRGTPRDFNSR